MTSFVSLVLSSINFQLDVQVSDSNADTLDITKSMFQGEKRKSQESSALQGKEVKYEHVEVFVIADSDDDSANGSTPNSKTPSPSSASSAADASKAAVIYLHFLSIIFFKTNVEIRKIDPSSARRRARPLQWRGPSPPALPSGAAKSRTSETTFLITPYRRISWPPFH
jgi:hypothetical protein